MTLTLAYLLHGALALMMLGLCIFALRMARGLPQLSDLPAEGPDAWPTLSIIVPACDEAEGIEPASQSLLAADYPALELVLVDDRSRDRTPEIIDALAGADPRVTALHIDQLPDGWLGKVHALHQGVARSEGEWLLFLDADIALAASTLRRAVAHAEQHALDLLSVWPQVRSGGFWADTVFDLAGAFSAAAQPWKMRDPDSDVAVGSGAFILVRRRAFDASPGFSWLRLEVADDQALPLMIKRHGGRCDLVGGRGEVSLVWYASLREMIAKMQKNWFGIVGRFSLGRSLAFAAVHLGLGLWPLSVLGALHQPALLGLIAGGNLCLIAASLCMARWAGRRALPAFFPHIGLLLVAYQLVRAGFIGHRLGGITWRGQLYPSAQLRDHQRYRFP